MRNRVAIAVCLSVILSTRTASAQNWSFDARDIALGGVGGGGNLATAMIDEARDYRSIVLPFGLIQVLKDKEVFNPSSDNFDIIRSVEYAASPIHYVFGRGTTDSGSRFVTDIRKATLSRDLNVYRGFVPANNTTAEGLASPSWGGTIKFRKDASGGFQGVYIGGGPYLSDRTAATIDQGFTNFLASDTPVFAPNARFPLNTTTEAQFALAITGGYRGRFSAGTGSMRDGLYLAANYTFLHGFEYDESVIDAQITTNAAGLVSVVPGVTPLVIGRRHSGSGRGFAIDAGVGAVMNHVEVGFAANGIANRINWTELERTTYSLNSLFSGGDFLESATVPFPDRRVELPVNYRGNAAYRTDGWAVEAQAGHGLGGASFHGGVERRFGRSELRGGMRYTSEKWNPTGGVGFDLTPHVSFDVAAFGTSANIERKRQLAIAASIRLNRMN